MFLSINPMHSDYKWQNLDLSISAVHSQQTNQHKAITTEEYSGKAIRQCIQTLHISSTCSVTLHVQK